MFQSLCGVDNVVFLAKFRFIKTLENPARLNATNSVTKIFLSHAHIMQGDFYIAESSYGEKSVFKIPGQFPPAG